MSPKILDGAMGTELLGLGFKPPFEELSITHPEIIKKVHQAYILSGSEIILTHTFSAQTLKVCEASWEIVKDLKAKKFVALGPEANHKLVVDFFKDKCDQFVFETIYSLELASKLINDYAFLNPIFSFTLKPHDFLRVLSLMKSHQLSCIGLNCMDGFNDVEEMLGMIPSHYKIYLKPNAGKEKISPQDFAMRIMELNKKFPLAYVGGCCGTSPQYIKEIQKVLLDT